MKVTNEMVRAARKAWGDHCATSATTLDDMMRAALEAALSHAAGQDGEQCRVASGVEEIARQMDAMAGHIQASSPEQKSERLRGWASMLRALSCGVPEDEPFVSCTCHEERQKQLCLNKHRCVRAYPLAAIAAQRKEGE